MALEKAPSASPRSRAKARCSPCRCHISSPGDAVDKDLARQSADLFVSVITLGEIRARFLSRIHGEPVQDLTAASESASDNIDLF